MIERFRTAFGGRPLAQRDVVLAPDPCTLPCHPPRAELRRVAAEQEWPRLSIARACPGLWGWMLAGPHGETLDGGRASTHGEALAVGLAALEVASLHPTR